MTGRHRSTSRWFGRKAEPGPVLGEGAVESSWTARFRPSRRPGLRGGLQSLRRAASWHRRKLAVLCAVAATLTGLTALAPPRPPTVDVVRAATDLAGGVVLTGANVRRDRLPRDALPDGTLDDPASVIGRMLAGRVPNGQILTAADLVGGRSPTTAGQVIAPVRIADSEVTALISDGDLVDVVRAEEQTGTAKIVAARVRVVGVPTSSRESVATGNGGLILVEVDPQTATALASASVSARLSVIWR